MQMNNGTIWKWLTVVLTGILISLIALIYYQLVGANAKAETETNAVAQKLETYQNSRIEIDTKVSNAIIELKVRAENTDKNVQEIIRRLEKYGVVK
jgi:uncharacterized protein YpmS